MRRARSLRLQDGQTGAEFIGLLGLVGLIVGALFAAGVHERIAAGVNRAICTIDELSALARGAADLSGVESALTEPPRPDALWYRFTYRGRQVETDAPAMPAELRPLIGTFIGLIDRYGPQ